MTTRTHAQPTTATYSTARKQIMQIRIEGILKAHGLLTRWRQGSISYVKLTKKGYMPLVIERVTTLAASGIVPAVSVAHFFVQEGDVMYDPEIVFTADAWEATEITQHPVGMYRAKYHRRGTLKLVDTRFRSQVQPLVRMWAGNLKEQGWADTQSTQVKTAE